jgi:uncharacterized protein (DUF305 family)
MRPIAIAMLLVALGPLAWAGDAMPGMSHGAMPGTGADAAGPFDPAMQKMHAAMMQPPTGNVDVDFVRGMIPHHQGAIDMARIELEKGTDPEIRALAEAIIAAQEEEIATMQAWLAAHGG